MNSTMWRLRSLRSRATCGVQEAGNVTAGMPKNAQLWSQRDNFCNQALQPAPGQDCKAAPTLWSATCLLDKQLHLAGVLQQLLQHRQNVKEELCALNTAMKTYQMRQPQQIAELPACKTAPSLAAPQLNHIAERQH